MSVKKYESMDDEFLDYIPMKIDKVCDLEFNIPEFKKGIKDVSYYVGIYVGFINAGIEDEDAIEMLKLIMNGKLNTDKLNKEVQIK